MIFLDVIIEFSISVLQSSVNAARESTRDSIQCHKSCERRRSPRRRTLLLIVVIVCLFSLFSGGSCHVARLRQFTNSYVGAR